MEDFGTILAKWDASQAKQKSAPHSDVAGAENMWLRTHGTIDKDAIEQQVNDAHLNKNINYLKSLPWEDTLDLHGLTQDKAWSQLELFIERSRARKLRKVLIIHGKGLHTKGSEGVLGELVRRFIEQNKHLGLSGHPDREHGGTGATWVIIKI